MNINRIQHLKNQIAHLRDWIAIETNYLRVDYLDKDYQRTLLAINNLKQHIKNINKLKL